MKIAAVFANLSVLLTFAIAAALFNYDESLYYLSVQEDQQVEWASFWAFVAACAIYFSSALRELKERRSIPWFLFGLSLFCLFVAMEEISWGQRLFGYKAPDYFLEENYQQELNFHNVVDTGTRKLALQFILLGYGVILSAFSLWPPLSQVFRRLRVIPPSPVLIISFFAMFVFYSWYPWSHTGEWVELTMGFGFVYAALFADAQRYRSALTAVVASFATILILAVLTVFAIGSLTSQDPGKVEQARLEVEALARDFSSGRLQTRCGIHKRLYTFMHEYQQPYLLEGEFARLLQSRGANDRASYLLDPWNSAYWIRHKCDGGREARFVYSFGPNRRRDSSEWQLRDQDIGAYVAQRR